jgi:8-oxo-dGTP pyrophosphatase MutT (NUDIX family)
MLRHRQFACAVLIDGFGRFLLQQRDDIPDIVDPGKIGLFGGGRECGETYLQCIVREVNEELSYFLTVLTATQSFRASFSWRGMCQSKKSRSLRERFSSRSYASFRLWNIACHPWVRWA